MKLKEDSVNIYYHKNCSDGFGSAWAAYLYFGDSANYIPVSHDQELFFDYDSINYFLDFSPKEKYISDLEKRSKEIYIIDHHISSYDYLKNKNYYYFDLKHSGCVLTWKYFFPDIKIPKILLYIEDRDLWKNELKNTSEVFLFSNTYKYSFDEWNNLSSFLESNEEEVIKIGGYLDRYRETVISKMLKTKHYLNIGGYDVKSINSPYFQSYMLSKEYENEPFMASYYFDGDKYIFSLRSCKDSDISLADISKIYGGGGHKNAAGFSVKKIWHLKYFYYKNFIIKIIKRILRAVK